MSHQQHPGRVWVPGGTFLMGSDHHYPEEAPARSATVTGFWIDSVPVTNAAFAAFVQATGHVTAAERAPDPADYPGADPALLVPASVVFASPPHRVDLRDHLQWWRYVPGADWRHPYGPHTTIDGLDQHPVVHIGFDDAVAYAAWAGGELPTETEWEYAARGAADGEYAWGDEFTPAGRHMANTWQGEFPLVNLATDGYDRTSPVAAFPANGYGLHDMIGNVWEWTADWYAKPAAQSSCCGRPRTPAERDSYDPATPHPRIGRKVTKGGSFLCAPNYCRRYRPPARMAQPIDTTICHLGFRTVNRLVDVVTAPSSGR